MVDSAKNGMMMLAGMQRYCRSNYKGGVSDDRFGGMFGDLPPGYVGQKVLSRLGSPGGPMDSGSKKTKTHSVAVGMIFFGQEQ